MPECYHRPGPRWQFELERRYPRHCKEDLDCLNQQGKLHLSIVNLDPNRAAEITTKVTGSIVRHTTGEVITSSTMNAMSTFYNPDTIRSTPFSGYSIQDAQVNVSIPPKSVVMLELQ
jgi:alpha-N-arabinofuranosidase